MAWTTQNENDMIDQMVAVAAQLERVVVEARRVVAMADVHDVENTSAHSSTTYKDLSSAEVSIGIQLCRHIMAFYEDGVDGAPALDRRTAVLTFAKFIR